MSGTPTGRWLPNEGTPNPAIHQPGVMYATWTLKNGKKRLEEVRFRKQKS